MNGLPSLIHLSHPPLLIRSTLQEHLVCTCSRVRCCRFSSAGHRSQLSDASMPSANLSRSNSTVKQQPHKLQYTVSDAALIGACLAFSNPATKPKPLVSQYSGGHGALAPATTAARRKPTCEAHASPKSNSDEASLSPQNSRNSYRATPSPITQPRGSVSATALANPFIEPASCSGSSSRTAANAAAVRLRTMPPQSARERGGRLEQDTLLCAGTVSSARARLDALTDHGADRGKGTEPVGQSKNATPSFKMHPRNTAPIACTTSLARLFEQDIAERDFGHKNFSSRTKNVSPPTISPKPQLEFKPIASTSRNNLTSTGSTATMEPSMDTAKTIPPLASAASSVDGQDSSSGKQRAVGNLGAKLKPGPPPRWVRQLVVNDEPSTKAVNPRPSTRDPAIHDLPHKESSRKPLPDRPLLTPSETFKRPPATAAGSMYKDASLRQIMPHMTGDSLANAIVGAHLATSRGPSPIRSPAPAPAMPRRKEHHNHLHLFHHPRPPSPPRAKPITLRQTMRQEPSSSDSGDNDGYRHRSRKKHLVRKHPNKHHEGDRKRWRDTVTERERKRYEGVWAANKGLFLSHPAPYGSREIIKLQDEVLNLVAREVWCRSRLPGAELEEVWDLVDSRRVGRLTKDEFVVGLWLVDQRLKGRKLPVRVSESVWGSVRYAGLKIRRMR